MIRCRLPKHALRELGLFLTDAHERSQGPYFIVRGDRNQSQEAKQIMITDDMIQNLFKSQWRTGIIRIKIPSMLVLTEIVLCIRRDEEFPISGFPRSIPQENARYRIVLSQTMIF